MSNTTIQIKKSGVTGNVPSGLNFGEIAINYADGKLYYKSNSGSTTYITNQQSFATINSNNSLILATSGSDILNLLTGTFLSFLCKLIILNLMYSKFRGYQFVSSS
jgi:hypothetical protein